MRNLKDKLLNEVILYGGLPVKRGNVYIDVLRRTNSHWAADLYAFGPYGKVVENEPLTLAEFSTIIAP